MNSTHAKSYRSLMEKECKEFEVTACCDTREELAQKRAKEIGEFQGKIPRLFTEIEEMSASGLIDAVDICLPHHLHHSVAISFLESGHHVLIEKPLGITLRAGKEIIEAGEKYDRVVAMAENIRRYPLTRAVEWGINKTKLVGDIYNRSCPTFCLFL